LNELLAHKDASVISSKDNDFEDMQDLLNKSMEKSHSFNFAEMQQALCKRPKRNGLNSKGSKSESSDDEPESDID